ncbi:MAG: Branched-chain acyl-CoA dehydrogenase [uncultured Sphingomonas sp.]|uniref:Branched-chain acyl-CoA dehydrogenase n=1 Tax=uncultured Sphingomonas sp. TaxID=158754 RepID=A0A6J4T1C2_9SPHN|nr:acyl-CoA dehydrogenase family protein [uncultured Sphingomonas sp.]CAA9511062.1 MAG: Branched-chain acyl-CoA dehydrogenase [uncultured Sphingomonas sp.]
MHQFELTDDQLQIQEMARQFTAAEITPNAGEWDEKHIFPVDTIRKAAELGFGAIYVSEESGGIGLGRLESALIMEAMAYGCPSTSAFISIHNMTAWMIDRFGSDDVKSRYLPSMIPMERMGSYCLTEPASGSDAAALKTKAVLDGDHYVVSGSKAFISGGGENDIYVTMVRTGGEGPKGITALVIEKDMAGVSFGAQEKKLGWHSQPTAQVNFDEVRVPVGNRVGGEGEGFRIAMMGLDGGRLNIGACSLGGAQRCLDEAIGYTKTRTQFGQPLTEFQNTQFTLADMETELQAARWLLYVAAAKVTANAPDKTKFAAMAKRLATDTGSSVVDRALQLHGGYGYLQDYPIERFWRDLRVHSILEGTNQVMRVITSREMLRQ